MSRVVVWARGDQGLRPSPELARKETGSGSSEDCRDDLCILCVMNMGNGAGFVYRDEKRG